MNKTGQYLESMTTTQHVYFSHDIRIGSLDKRVWQAICLLKQTSRSYVLNSNKVFIVLLVVTI